MKKVGKLMAVEQQLCYEHDVQLAVLDVLYCQTSTAAVDEEPETESTTTKDDDNDDAMAGAPGIVHHTTLYHYYKTKNIDM